MDEIDLELEEMVKEIEGQAKCRRIDSGIIEFLHKHRTATDISLKDAVGIDMILFGADVSGKGSFTLYTDSATIHGSVLDYCTDILHKILNEAVENRGQLIYDRETGYFYMFPSGIPFKVITEGRIFKRYSFEVGL